MISKNVSLLMILCEERRNKLREGEVEHSVGRPASVLVVDTGASSFSGSIEFLSMVSAVGFRKGRHRLVGRHSQVSGKVDIGCLASTAAYQERPSTEVFEVFNPHCRTS